ncbi:hypothetical protein IFM89_017873 [Coptis chinensis]|uniref:Leucine-rich repeat-containing N-terminal plant-type domain-containing protein n=1 Tax=Coptis chinensis TaxID=261450 RepID=A0A835ITY6_9MAGN|nr:hypothetical protein IFM89_017873 [Coptis chinensis]
MFLSVLYVVLTVTYSHTSADTYWFLRIKSKFVDTEGVLDSWSPGANICSWNGLKCSANFTQVVSLNLSGSGLAGSISPEVSHIISLQTLDLSSNFLIGTIPPELGQLENLKELHLYSNFISGKIPAEIGLFEELASS